VGYGRDTSLWRLRALLVAAGLIFLAGLGAVLTVLLG
jgi:hypothetical protein